MHGGGPSPVGGGGGGGGGGGPPMIPNDPRFVAIGILFIAYFVSMPVRSFARSKMPLRIIGNTMVESWNVSYVTIIFGGLVNFVLVTAAVVLLVFYNEPRLASVSFTMYVLMIGLVAFMVILVDAGTSALTHAKANIVTLINMLFATLCAITLAVLTVKLAVDNSQDLRVREPEHSIFAAVAFCINAVWIIIVSYNLWARSQDVLADAMMYNKGRRNRYYNDGGDPKAFAMAGSHVHGDVHLGGVRIQDSNFAGNGGNDAGGGGGAAGDEGSSESSV